MNAHSYYKCFWILATVVFLVLAGCGGDSTSLETDPHAGHDHDPGEHGREATEVAATNDDILDWCTEHAVPESQCTKCNPTLIETYKANNDWCAGHGLPESHCRLCNPEIKFPQEDILRARTIELTRNDIEITLYFRPNEPVCATNDALIQFASAETAERTGLKVLTVRDAAEEYSIEAPAEVVFDETHAIVVTTTVPALVSRWAVSPGDNVRAGDILAVMQSPRITELEAQLLSAYAAYELQRKETSRHEELKSRNLISTSEYDEQCAMLEKSLAEYAGVRGFLTSAGLSETDLDELLKHRRISNTFALRASGSGMIVERIAKPGELYEAGAALAALANPEEMWIEARLTEQQLRDIEVGQEVTFSSDGRGLNRIGAEVIWVSKFLDPHTRTGVVRAMVPDKKHSLKAGEFGRVAIVEREENDVVLVPKDAVQWEGCCNVVFVREALDRYRPRKVELSEGTGPYYQVRGGLQPGEEVVVDGAFLLKTELKKTSIGAGCCGLEPVG